jgi:hypothetical protein
MAAFTNIRSNLNMPFPSTVIGQGPVTIGKANGIWTVNLNINTIGQLGTLPAGSLFLAYNPTGPGWFSTAATLGSITYRLTSNFTSTNQATPQPTSLSFVLQPGNYLIHGVLPSTGGSGAGIAWNLSLTGGSFSYTIFDSWTIGAAGGFSGFTQTTGSLPSNLNSNTGNITSYFDMAITISVAGTVTLNFSQDVSSANVSTLLQGSTITITPSSN